MQLKAPSPPFPLPPKANEKESVAITPLHPKPIALLPAIAKEEQSTDQEQENGEENKEENDEV